MRPFHGLFLILIVLAAAPAPLSAQILRGVVMEDASEAALPAAHVRLFDADGKLAGEAVADSLGAFVIAVPRAGTYALRAERIGFRPATSPEFEVRRDERLDIELRLMVDAVLLAPLTVVERARPLLQGGKFYELRERQEHIRKTGIGHFVTREDIVQANPIRLTDVFRRIAGVRVTNSGRTMGRQIVRLVRTQDLRGDCPPVVFLDGLQIGIGEPADALIYEMSAFTLEGIEVYRGLSEVPAEFGVQEARCGVIALWSKRGA